MPLQVVVLGVPSALGGWLPSATERVKSMANAPVELRSRGFLERVAAGLAGSGRLDDAGDVLVEPPWREDGDRRTKNRGPLLELLPRIGGRIAEALGSAAPDARLLVLGGDCTTHPAALAGLRRARPGLRLALACGRGDPALVAAVAGPTVRPEDCALLGGQVLDELESRALATSPVAHFGAGMLAETAGMAALAAWAASVAERVHGFYVALDHDVLDSAGGWAVMMPEPGGMGPETVLGAIGALAAAGRIVGYGATGISLAAGDPGRTVDAAAGLAVAALA